MLPSNRRRFLRFLAATTGLTLTSHLWGCNSQTSSQSQNQKLETLTIGGSPIL